MAKKFAVLDKTVKLTATIPKKYTNYSQAKLTIFRIKKDKTRQEYEKDRVIQLSAGVGTYEWTAKGPEKEEMYCDVRVEWKAEGTFSNSSAIEDLVVYRRSIDVEAVKDGHEDQKMPCASFRVRFTRHAEYEGETRNPKTEWETSEQGQVTIDNLPPGELDIEWVHPYSLGAKEWFKEATYTQTGGKRKAVLKKEGCRAAFVWPPYARLDEVEGIRVYEQIVNLNRNDQIADDPPSGCLVQGSPDFGAGHPEYGADIKIGVCIDARDGGGQAGDEIFVKAEFGANNSDRNADPAPAFEGTAAAKGSTHTKTLTLTGGSLAALRGGPARHAQVKTFSLNLGAAGGDEVTISIGSTEECKDQKIKIVNWRRLYFRPVVAQSAPLTLPDGTIDRITGILESVFVRFVALESHQVPDAEVPFVKKINATLAIFGVTNAQESVIFLGLTKKSFVDLQSTQAANLPTSPPTSYAVVGHGCLDPIKNPNQPEGELFGPEFDATSRNRWSGAVKSQQNAVFLKPSLHPGGACVVRGRYTAGDQDGPITDDMITVDATGESFTVEVPSNVRGKVVCDLRLRSYKATGGASPGRPSPFICTTGVAVEDWTYVILHELSHSLGHAVTASDQPPGLLATSHPDVYGAGTHKDSDDRGHQGPHCRFEFPLKYHNEPNYSIVTKEHKCHGNCILWGAGSRTPGRMKYDKLLKFCPSCTKFMKATKIEFA